MPNALLHFSEDPNIEVFAPHVAPTAQVEGARVWAIDAVHAPSYWFPRQCPRACVWPTAEKPMTERGAPLVEHGGARRMHAIESAWLDGLRACQLYVYRFDPAPFSLEPNSGGSWCARESVRPLSVEPVGDLLAKHAEAGIELRIVPRLWPLVDAILASGLEFSIIRSRNMAPRA